MEIVFTLNLLAPTPDRWGHLFELGWWGFNPNSDRDGERWQVFHADLGERVRDLTSRGHRVVLGDSDHNHHAAAVLAQLGLDTHQG
jgi:hypothetical protein